jgi:type II secretory pathway pseudopilin PulG
MTERTSLRLHRRRGSRGFTLVELMVAVTGGLFVSLAVFAIARESGRFYNRESRMSDATLSAVLGFERLKTDIARAGFLGTPNVRQDPHLCGDPVGDGTWPTMFRRLAALSIQHQGSPSNPTLNAAGNDLHPDAITLMGSYSAAEEFPTWNIADTGSNYTVYLQENTGPLARLGYKTSTNPMQLLQGVFGAGRGLRIQDQSGEIQFATIQSVAVNPPRVNLTYAPKLRFRQTNATCGLKGNVTGAVVSVMNFVRYELKKAATAPYNPIYDAGGHPYDTDRTDLVRTELGTDGNPLTNPGDNTEEIVAEYAVNLQFGITRVTGFTNNAPDGFAELAPGNPTISTFAGDLVNEVVNPSDGPNRLRAVRVRLSVRSQDPDRLTSAGDAGVYRVGLGTAGGAPYSRLRTLQADVALNNQMAVTY